jgi:hypothetical protein
MLCIAGRRIEHNENKLYGVPKTLPLHVVRKQYKRVQPLLTWAGRQFHKIVLLAKNKIMPQKYNVASRVREDLENSTEQKNQ